MSSAAEVRDALARLRARSAKLRARDPREVIDRLAAVLDAWRDPSSAWRTRLEREHPPASGFHPAVVREGLSVALAEWSGESLRELIARELDGDEIPTGFDTTAVVLAGAIPMPTLQAMLLPLALRSPILVKTPVRDPVAAKLVAESVREQDPELGSCIEVVSFRGTDEDCTQAMLEAPCVLAYGSDETVASLRSRISSSQRLVAYGQRMSVAVLGDEATRGDALSEAAAALALDTALWDQLGCLSPVAVYVEDLDGKASERVAHALAEALRATAKQLPCGELATAAAATISRERAEAEMRAAAGERCVVYSGSALDWTVVLEADARWRPSPLHRFLHVHPIASQAALGDILAPISKHLASVGVAGAQTGVIEEIRRLGVSRTSPLGEMQAPPFGWHHDEGPVLLPLARITDLAR